MLILRIILMGIILLVIPTAVGTLFTNVDRRNKSLPFLWISGQMLLWVGFEVITVPLVLRQGKMSQVVQFYIGYIVIMTLLAVICYVVRRRKNGKGLHVVNAMLNPVSEAVSKTQKIEKYVLWGTFGALLLFQLFQAVRMTYADGDDAYYVAVANLAEESNTLYQKAAYTGGIETFDARYGLAPFPIWLAFLARISGIRTVSVAHVIAPLALISMTYAIYYLVGSKLFAKHRERIPLFLVFTELLVIFGDYSFFTAENFMIARSRQGKSALGNIIFPMLIYLLLLLLERIQEEQKVSAAFWVLLFATLTTGCLCSTLGTLLTCMLVGVTGICAAICYRKWKILIPLAACCTPCVVVALLYVLL